MHEVAPGLPGAAAVPRQPSHPRVADLAAALVASESPQQVRSACLEAQQKRPTVVPLPVAVAAVSMAERAPSSSSSSSLLPLGAAREAAPAL